jgi:signal transduction histidine kinase
MHELTEQYSAALREYCAKGGDAALSWAFQPSLLGHRAAREGLGVLEMAAMHQKALVDTLLEMLSVDETTRIANRASEFVAEALAPFEDGCPREEESSTLGEGQRERDELKATQQKLQAALDQLRERKRAEQRKNEFICVMSHMTHGSLSVLMSGLGGELNAHGQRLLEVALRNSERVLSLVGDSPDMQRVESGAMTFDAARTSAGSGSASS